MHDDEVNNSGTRNRGVRETLISLHRTLPGSHLIVVYPELSALREIYANYIIDQLGSNEVVLILPYYDTVENVNNTLLKFQYRHQNLINVEDHLTSGSLMIVDAQEVFFNHKQEIEGNEFHTGSIVSLMRILQTQAKKLGKKGITILVDLGCFFVNGGADYLLQYEKSIPNMFKDTALKQLCMYHQLDFEHRFSDKDKAKLIDQHGRSVILMDNK